MRGIAIILLWLYAFTASANSDSVMKSLREQASYAPEQVISKLDSLDRNANYPEYLLNYFRACAYFKLSMFQRAFDCAEKAFKSMEILSDTMVYRQACMILAESSVFSYSLNKATHYIQTGKTYAISHSDDILLANMLLSEGDLYRRLGLNNRSYECVFQAIKMLTPEHSLSDAYHLSHAYGFLMRYYIYDGKYAEAWRIGKAREKVLLRLDKPLRLDHQNGFLYSKMAFLAHVLGRKSEAQEYYRKFQETFFSKTYVGRLEINDYLLSIGNYDQVIANVRDYAKEMDKRDTLNMSYVRLLQQATSAYEALEDYHSAFLMVKRRLSIQKSMRENNERNYLMENADVFHTMTMKKRLTETEHQLKYQNIYLLLSSVLSVLLLVCIGWVIWKNRIIRRKNKKMAYLILEVEKQRLHKIQEESFRIPQEKKTEEVHVEETPIEEFQVEEVHNEKTESFSVVSRPNKTPSAPLCGKELFELFDQRVRQDKLFLDYQLGRDDYARVMGVDKNRFASLMKEYGGVHLNTYLNNLRLEHSIDLFRNHPEWSINEIASQSALPNTSTFYRLFKEKYGMSPNVFRNQIKSE